MTISNHIEKIKDRLRRGEFTSEAAVSQGILLPALHELGWPVFDTNIVMPGYSIEGRRVDYALCHPPTRPSVFVEVKKVGLSDGADRQLFEYAFHLGVPMAILTDGQEWSFYLPGEQGRYDQRRVYKLDLLERDIEEAVKRLEKYLQYERVSLPPQPTTRPTKTTKGVTAEKPHQTPRTRTVDTFSFSFEGKTYQVGSAREVMIKVFQLLADTDAGFLDRFASRKHGKKRRYIAREKTELYPGRLDLAEEHSVEIAPGWWMGTNYSRSNIQQILDLALEVVEPRFLSSLRVNVQ